MGKNYSISTKYAVAICRFIRGKTITEALDMLEQVRKKRIAVPMRAEIGHRKGMERGRYPVRASLQFINLLKNLRGIASGKNLEADTTVIKIAKANKGETPVRAGRRGRRGKRTHILLIGEGKEDIQKVKEKPKPKVKEEMKEKKVETEKEKEQKTEQKTEKTEEKEKVEERKEVKEQTPEKQEEKKE